MEVNKCRLVIDYQYLNSFPEGHEVPQPDIEDLLARQHGNHLWTILNLDDAFHQMPLTKESRPLLKKVYHLYPISPPSFLPLSLTLTSPALPCFTKFKVQNSCE